MGSIKDKCAIVGMGCSKFGERWDCGFDDLVVEAGFEAYEDAGIGYKDIDAAWIGITTSSRSGEALSRPLKLDYIPITHVNNNCGSALEALRNGCFAIAAGVYDVVLAVGADKLKDSGFRGLRTSGDTGYWRPLEDYGFGAPGWYALAATRYFNAYGIEPQKGKEALAKIAVKNHHNGTLSPKAHMRVEITVERAMKAPLIAWPLGLFDCCPVTDGSAAAIITRADLAKKFRDDYVLVKGLGCSVGPGFGRFDTDYDYIHFEEAGRSAKMAYADAGIKDPRKELDLAGIHDAFTIAELLEYEGLGFSPKGEAIKDVDANTFALDGELPVNTDGGLKAFGHPIGATGLRVIYELYKQIQGKADRRQLKNPKLGLAFNEGGAPGSFQAVSAIVGAP